jgi:hypothetical protein
LLKSAILLCNAFKNILVYYEVVLFLETIKQFNGYHSNQVTIALFPGSRWSGEESGGTSNATGKLYNRIQWIYPNITNRDIW